MARGLTIDDLRKSPVAHLNKHLFATPAAALKKSKYGSSKTEVNGIVFDSKKEANRYKELLLLMKAGTIELLELQVTYELNEGGSHSIKYVADFVYVDGKSGQKIVEDAKGFRTREYIKKRKLMFKVHGIKIHEI